MKRLPITAALVALVALVAAVSVSSVSAKPHSTLTFGYVSPGPDTWYQRDVDGFKYAAKKYGAKVVVLNSQYDQQKELQNIQSLVNQGVDGISMFSFNQNGALVAAQQGLKNKIPVVLTDDVGHALTKGAKVAATVDFDWCGMGKAYAKWIATNYPKQPYAMLAGNFQAPPTQILDKCLMDTAKKLGNPLAAIRETSYSPEKAVNLATDLVQSGKQFRVMFVMDEDMAASVARMLKAKGLLNTKIVLIAQNGSPVGMQMLKEGTLKYTISSSPGWEGQVAFLALYRAAMKQMSATGNTRFNLPVIPITKGNINDPSKVVPWEPAPVYWTLTKKYFPQLVAGK